MFASSARKAIIFTGTTCLSSSTTAMAVHPFPLRHLLDTRREAHCAASRNLCQWPTVSPSLKQLQILPCHSLIPGSRRVGTEKCRTRKVSPACSVQHTRCLATRRGPASTGCGQHFVVHAPQPRRHACLAPTEDSHSCRHNNNSPWPTSWVFIARLLHKKNFCHRGVPQHPPVPFHYCRLPSFTCTSLPYSGFHEPTATQQLLSKKSNALPDMYNASQHTYKIIGREGGGGGEAEKKFLLLLPCAQKTDKTLMHTGISTQSCLVNMNMPQYGGNFQWLVGRQEPVPRHYYSNPQPRPGTSVAGTSPVPQGTLGRLVADTGS